MTKINNTFNERTEPNAAYTQLKTIFADWQGHQDRFDLLSAQNWLGLDGGDTKDLTAERLAVMISLNDPKLNVPELLQTAKKGIVGLSPMDQANLKTMEDIYAARSGFVGNPETIAAYAEELAGSSEKFWTIREKLGHIEELHSRHMARIDASGAPPTRRQETHQLKLEHQMREEKKNAFEQTKAMLVPMMEQKRLLLSPASKALGIPVSEVALREWNPAIKSADIDRIFESVKSSYPEFYAKAETIAKNNTPEPALPLPLVPIADQKRLFMRLRDTVLESAGWDQSRMKEAGINSHFSLHKGGLSMCWGAPQEQYMVVAASNKNLMAGVFNTMHESGHLAYLLGLTEMDKSLKGQPVAQINGYGTHEVSAMTNEAITADKKFFELVAPIIREELHVDGPEWSAENLYRISQRQESTDWSAGGIDCIPEVAWRVKASRLLLDGPGKVEDAVDAIPHLWAKTMEEYTGKPHDPADFSFEEDHWVTDMESYFYAYAHGAMGAALVCDKTKRSLPEEKTAETLVDYLRPYTDTLRQDIHLKGRVSDPIAMLEQGMGRKLDATPLMERLGVSTTVNQNTPKTSNSMQM
jgi:Zn-dependent M32 family carboxypeptidase